MNTLATIRMLVEAALLLVEMVDASIGNAARLANLLNTSHAGHVGTTLVEVHKVSSARR